MFDPDETVNGISSYIKLKLKTLKRPVHFYYISDDEVGLSEDELKRSFMFFVEKKFLNIEHISIGKIKDDFEYLSEKDKEKYFSSKINVIDCSEINQESVSAYHCLNNLSKDIKTLLFYYIPKKKKEEFDIASKKYKSDGVYYDLDKEIYSFYEYNNLKDELNANKDFKKPQKKPKI
jgi:hypothetical protein